MKVNFRYLAINVKTGKVSYFKNGEQLARMLRIGKPKAVKMARNGDTFNYYKLEALKEAITIDVPKTGDIVTIEGVSCYVINVYDRTFSVITESGTRLVKIDSMSFVENTVDNYDRLNQLKTRKF